MRKHPKRSPRTINLLPERGSLDRIELSVQRILRLRFVSLPTGWLNSYPAGNVDLQKCLNRTSLDSARFAGETDGIPETAMAVPIDCHTASA